MAFLYLHIFKRDLLNYEIWLIAEKRTEARDNGYHLYKYLTKNQKEILPVYVINKKSVDYKKIKDFGKVVQYDSFEHFVYFIAAKYRIGGQIQGGKPYINVAKQDTLKCIRNPRQVHFYIKHGIAKDDIPGAYDYRLAGYDVMFCGSKKEYAYYKVKYNYPEERICCPGLCRFDNLMSSHITEKIVLIMPTYRKWLQPNDSSKEANIGEREKFISSEFYDRFLLLLNDEELLSGLKKYGYHIIFYPHYTLQPYLDTFNDKGIDLSVVTLADRQSYDVQELLMKSAILITDYSSVFFDFGYMKKPIIFYQFDDEKYREDHYAKGWFDYSTDAMGPVFKEKKEVVQYVLKCCSNNAVMEKKYVKRLQGLFEYVDAENCHRVYDTIKNY